MIPIADISYVVYDGVLIICFRSIAADGKVYFSTLKVKGEQ